MSDARVDAACAVYEAIPLDHWMLKRDVRAMLDAADAVDPIRASHARLLEACKAAQALGVKRYHISTAHEAPMDWANVKTLLDAAIAAAEGGGE